MDNPERLLCLYLLYLRHKERRRNRARKRVRRLNTQRPVVAAAASFVSCNDSNSQEDEQHLQEDYGALDTLLKEEDLGCFDDTDADVNVEDTNSNTDSMPTASNIDSTPTASDQTGIRPRPTLARKRPATTTVQHKPETVQSKVQRVPDFCREDDEFDLFGKSIAVQLRNMPLERALVCQETLQAVMKQERLYQLHHMS